MLRAGGCHLFCILRLSPSAAHLRWDGKEKPRTGPLGKETPPERMGLGRGGKKIPGVRGGAGVAYFNLAAHGKQAHICCTA